MIKTVPLIAHAGDEDHVNLAKYYLSKGLTREEVKNLLKSKKYQVVLKKGLTRFNAISVMGIMQGIELATKKESTCQ